MKILIVHNKYRHRGGEDVCVENEFSALRDAGLDVVLFHTFNDRQTNTIRSSLGAPFGFFEEGALEKKLLEIKPDILHVHNLTPMLSPRLFSVARQRGIKTVQTLHNFRPLCLNGLFLTPAKKICELCASGNYTHGILRGCYRQSRLQSIWLAGLLSTSRRKGCYNCVDRFIAPAEFLKNKFVNHGWDAARFITQGHFLPEMPSDKPVEASPYVLYLGRLSSEKGILWLIEQFRNPAMPLHLHIGGDGPLRKQVKSRQNTHIRYLGRIEGEEKQNQLRHATALIMPSECYENFPLAMMEANAHGVPGLVSNLGGLSEIVSSGANGSAFECHNASSFWSKLEDLQKAGLPKRYGVQEYAQQRYSKASFMTRRQQIYRELLESPLPVR